ncbi:MAG: ATP-binding cassette domain-containing protein [ANME-2 cluster archaeon]|jgi:ABC-2 type transport system ATP-binding protein|nr:ATP-binding cassette domain-containing protein [ANME-2 cluster archaeon]
MIILELEHVSKSYSNKQIIDDISFSVDQGEIFGLLGPNGAGKTTTLRMMLDIIKPESGNIKVFGKNLDPDSKDRIGYLPEERGLYKKSKVIELLVYLAQLKGMTKTRALENAESLLQSVEMLEHKNKKIEELSKGMQQKIQFIATIIHGPDLIVVDEPFSGLDPVNTQIIKNILLQQKKAGKTIILSTHMMEQAEAMCDRILMINKGMIVLYGKVGDIKNEHRNNSIFLEFEGNISSFEELDQIENIIRHGTYVEIFIKEGHDVQSLIEDIVPRVRILRLEQSTPSLNEIFIKIAKGASS